MEGGKQKLIKDRSHGSLWRGGGRGDPRQAQGSRGWGCGAPEVSDERFRRDQSVPQRKRVTCHKRDA